jgi:hypothetical protein
LYNAKQKTMSGKDKQAYVSLGYARRVNEIWFQEEREKTMGEYSVRHLPKGKVFKVIPASSNFVIRQAGSNDVPTRWPGQLQLACDCCPRWCFPNEEVGLIFGREHRWLVVGLDLSDRAVHWSLRHLTPAGGWRADSRATLVASQTPGNDHHDIIVSTLGLGAWKWHQ